MKIIEELKIPEHLQEQALEHLLREASTGGASPELQDRNAISNPGRGVVAPELRKFIAEKRATKAVQVIPCLLYWAREKDNKQTANEKDIRDLYHLAKIRPPDNLSQSLRDLASKRYSRLEFVRGQKGYVRLTEVGENFVLYDLDAQPTAERA